MSVWAQLKRIERCMEKHNSLKEVSIFKMFLQWIKAALENSEKRQVGL